MRPKAAKEARTGLKKASWRRPNGGQERPESRGQRGLESLCLFGQALMRNGGRRGSPALILEGEGVYPPLKDGSMEAPPFANLPAIESISGQSQILSVRPYLIHGPSSIRPDSLGFARIRYDAL